MIVVVVAMDRQLGIAGLGMDPVPQIDSAGRQTVVHQILVAAGK